MADEIFGLTPRKPLPENWTPLEAVTVVKCLDENGHMALVTRSTDGITDWEGAGMHLAGLDTYRDSLREGFRAESDEPGGG